MTSARKSKKPNRRRHLWTAVMLTPILAVVVAIFLMGQEDNRPAIGGPFQMKRADGSAITEKALKDRFTFIYFGYTACPDVCPTSLATLATALDGVSYADAKKTQTLFVSVDPDRDQGQELDDYAKTFHPTFMGVTGSREQIDSMVAAYKAYYKIDKSSDPEFYPVDHSSILYLMDKDGHYLAHFSSNSPPEKITLKLKEVL